MFPCKDCLLLPNCHEQCDKLSKVRDSEAWFYTCELLIKENICPCCESLLRTIEENDHSYKQCTTCTYDNNIWKK